jgi:hypothetical protein
MASIGHVLVGAAAAKAYRGGQRVSPFLIYAVWPRRKRA